MARHDPDGVLRDEFLNSRGAIARFGRGSIEVRVIDVQECPRADLAVAVLVEGVLKLLVEERWASFEDQREFRHGGARGAPQPDGGQRRRDSTLALHCDA